MSDSKNMELNDEMMVQAAGGSGEKGRIENAVVLGPFYDDTDPSHAGVYRIKRDGCSSDEAAHYTAINILLPGTKVKVELVGMGRWQIVEILY